MKSSIRNRNQKGNRNESEIWLYSYADLVTNLMAFFVMLFVMTSTNKSNLHKLQNSIAKATGGTERPFSQDEVEFSDLAQSIHKEGLGGGLQVVEDSDGVRLTFSGGVFFDSASADLTEQAKETLLRLSPLFKKAASQYQIDIEGHSDFLPLKGSDRYPSNWELSSARSAAVLRYIASQGVAIGKMRAVGYADTKPISKDLEENRRVVIVVKKGGS